MRESFSFSPNSRIASAAGRRMLKPSLILRLSSPRMDEVISGVHAEAWGPLERAVQGLRGPWRPRVGGDALLYILM